MKINSIFFSPTGSTKEVADLIASEFSCLNDEVDISRQDFDAYICKEDEIYIIAAPTYSSRIGRIVSEKLARVESKGARAICLVTYGNRGFDDSLLELGDICLDRGFNVIAGLAASTEHNIFRDLTEDRPDKEDREELRGFSRKIIGKIESGDKSLPSLPGSRPYMDMVVSSLRPEVNDRCIKCFVCARSCPLEAIPMDDPTLTDDDACIACMRCIKICPSGARGLNPLVGKLAGKTMGHKLKTRKDNYLYI